MRKFFFAGGIIVFCSFQMYAQNVGIGTTTPTLGRLQVNGSVNNVAAIFGDEDGLSLQVDGSPAIGFNQYLLPTSASLSGGYAFRIRLDTAIGALVFEAPSAGTYLRRVTIWQGGNLSVNTLENNSSLFVTTRFTGTTTTQFRGTTYHSFFNQASGQSTTLNGGKLNSKVYINDLPTGNVYLGGGVSKIGINTSAPNAALHIKQYAGRGMLLVAPVYGFNNWEFAAYKNLTEAAADMYTFYNGVYKGNFFHKDGLYYKASDSRLKTNIKPLNPVLKSVMNLEADEYEMKFDNPGGRKSIGFIAQDVKKSFPEIISMTGDESTGYNLKNLQAINYDGFGILAIKAIQEQQQVITDLQENIKTYKKRLQDLKQPLTN